MPLGNSTPEFGEFNATILDVGQGLSVTVQTEKHTLLYDAGPSYSSGSSTGQFVVLPFFSARGIGNLDKLIISHDDIDHIEGVADVVKAIRVDKLMGDKLYKYKADTIDVCHAGQEWTWDGVKFSFLHPGKKTDYKGNNASCVLKIGKVKHSLLITGDIEYEAEDYLIEQYADYLKTNILLASHHGSITSSKSRFIRAVSPENVIFSTGYQNRFNLPNKDIITRYKRNGARTWNTASDGVIHIEYRNYEYKITTERHNRAKFWND